MGRKLNRGLVIGQIIAYVRKEAPNWINYTLLAHHLKVSGSYANEVCRLVGHHERDFEYHKGEIRYLGSKED
ncbi:MAG: hypothetical protein ACE5JU_20640 [Candidatus Binatia bacterium]